MTRIAILLIVLCAFQPAPVLAEIATDSAQKSTPRNAAVHAETLLRESKCTACHAAKFATASDKSGNAIYTRKNRSVSSYAKLVTQVARCDTELNLQVFEDDQALISQYLNTQFYKFKVPVDSLK